MWMVTLRALTWNQEWAIQRNSRAASCQALRPPGEILKPALGGDKKGHFNYNECDTDISSLPKVKNQDW
jgi:hypothetical protein